MPDFDKNLQPIIKRDEMPSIDIKLKEPVPVAPMSPVGFGGLSDLSGRRTVFDELNDATKNSDFTEKGIFITNKELSENKRYSAFNPTIPNYEDFAAYGQSNWDRAANGVLKGLNLAGTTIAGGLGMLLYGAPKAIFGGKLSYLWNNEIMQGLDDWNKKVDDEYLPNYYTQAEKDAEWYSRTNWLTTNFLFDKLIKNAGFAVGAMVSGNIANAGLLRAGSALGRAAASGAAVAESSQAFKLFTPLLRNTARAFSSAKNIEAAAILENQVSSIADITAKSSQLANIARTTTQFAKVNDAFRRTAISLYSSAGEASFEALQTSNEYRNNLIEDFKQKNGGLEPTGEDLKAIDEKANEVGKTSFLGNMALLSVTEFSQLPFLMGSTYNSTRAAANTLVGRADDIVLQGSKYVAKESTRVGKLVDKVSGVGRYVFDPKEAAQEVGQYALQVGSQNYFNKAALSDDASIWTDGFLYGLFGENQEGEGVGALVSKEGMESLVLGGITGGLMQAKGRYKEERARTQNTARFIDSLNGAPSFKEAFIDKLNAANRGVVLQQQYENAVITGNRLEATDLKTDMLLNYMSPRIKYGRFDMVMDDINELRTMATTEEGLAALKEQGMANINDTIPSYKERLDSVETVAKNTNNLYEATNLRYAGVTLADGVTRKYSPYVIDKMVYATSKIANYDVRIPQLNNKLIENGIVAGDVLSDVLKGKSPNRKATANVLNEINDLNVTSDIKDELKIALQDMINLGERRKIFMEEYEDMKANPLNYERSPEFNVGDKVELPVPVAGVQEPIRKLEVGKPYSLSEPFVVDNDKLVMAPKITVLSQTLGGELEVRMPSGKTQFIAPEDFDQFVLSEQENASDELNTLMDKVIDQVLGTEKYADIEKPTENKLNYINSLNDPELVKDVEKEFNTQAGEVIAKREEERKKRQELLKNKENLDKQQAEIENNSGIQSVDPTVAEAERVPEGKLKDARILFISGTSESEVEGVAVPVHVQSSREFLNNAKNFNNRNNLAAILVTAKNQAALGLSGLAQISFGVDVATDINVLPGADSVDDAIVMQVFVEQENGKMFFVNKNGERIGEVGKPVDIQQVVFQTMPTTSLTYADGNARYRKDQEALATAQSKAWRTKRAELLDNPAFPIKAYRFNISRGIPIENITGNIRERNQVGDVLIPENRIATEQGLLQISEGSVTHQGQNIKFPKGLTILQYGDTLSILSNSKLGDKKAKALYQVIKAMAEKYQKTGKLDRAYVDYVQNLLYWKKSATTKGNQIFMDANTVHLGGKTFDIVTLGENEKEIVDQLKETYHNINSKTLKERFYEPFVEYGVQNGELVEREWKNYQSYLLAGKNPDGSARNPEQNPLVTSAAKPTPQVPYSFKQKYATLIDMELPVQDAPKAAPAPAGAPTVGEFVMDGTTKNTFTAFKSGPVDFTGTIDANGNVSVEVIDNDTILNAAKDANLVNNAVVPKLKEANLFDPSADDIELVRTYVANILALELKKLQAPKEEAAPVATEAKADIERSGNKDIVKGSRLDEIRKIYAGNKSYINIKATNQEVADNLKSGNITAEELFSVRNSFGGELYKWFEKGFIGLTGKTYAEYDAELIALEGAKPTGEKYDVNNTSEPEDEYRRIGKAEAGEERLTDAEIELFKQWATENVPGLPFEVLDNIVNTHDNEKAWGVFENGVAKFYKGAIRGTEYHEAFEGIWKAFLTEDQRNAILADERAKGGTFTDRATRKKLEYATATDKQIKERIADDFADFRVGKLPARNLGEKVLKLFREIIQFFKSFVQKPSMKEGLFKAIDAGKFKEARVPEVVRAEAPEYKRIPRLTETEAYKFVQDMTARASFFIFGDSKKSLYDINTLTSKEIFDRIEQAYIKENKRQELGDDAWKALVKRTKENLRTLGVNFSEEERTSVNDENTSRADYAPEPFSVDWKKNSPFPVKFLGATLPEVEPTNQSDSSYLLLPKRVISSVRGYQLVNFGKVFATLMDKLSNTTGVKSFTKKIVNLAKSDATYVRFFKNLGGVVNKEGEEIAEDNGTFRFQYFKPEDWRLFVNAIDVFTKQKPEAYIQYIDGGQAYTAPANLFTASKLVQQDWFENIKALADNPKSAIKRDRKDKVFKVDKSVLPTAVPKTPEAMTSFLEQLGIIFPLPVYVKLNTFQQGDFGKAVSSIYTYLQDNAQVGTLTGETLGISGPLNELSDLYVKVTNPPQENAFRGIGDKMYQSYSNSNVPSVLRNQFDDATTLEQLKDARPELNDVFSTNSLTLKEGGQFFNEEGKRIKSLQVSYIQGTNNLGTGKENATTRLTLGDRYTQELNQNLKGNYYILVPADASTEGMINLGNHISFTDVETGRAWNKIYKIFRDYLTDEVALALDADNRKQLLYVGNKATELRFFKEILPADMVETIHSMVESGSTQEQIEEYISNNIEKVNASVKELIDSTVIGTKNILLDNNQIVRTVDSAFSYPTLEDSFAIREGIKKFNMDEDTLNNVLTFANTNYIINNIELHKIIFGDPYQFKIENGKLDETKRIKSFLSPRRITVDFPEFNASLNDLYNKVGEIALKEGDPGYHTFKDYTDTVTFRDIEFGTSTYKKVNEADAASWIMDNTYREVKIKNGQWSTEAENWHQWQMAYTRQALANKGEYAYTNGALQKADEQLVATPEPTFVTEVLKPIVSGVKQAENKIDNVLDKFSQMPIYLKAIEGTNLEKLYTKMWKEGIGYAVMESGRKVGATELNNIYTADGEFNDAPFKGVVKVAWKSYGIQVENSFEDPKDQTRGSQLTKLASLDLFENGKASSTAKKAFDRNKEALDKLHENGYKQLLSKLGVEDLGDGYALVDPKAVQETLEYELLRRELSENAKDTIQLDENGQFIIPFEASSAYQQIKNILYSMVNKAITSPKMNGSPKVQVPSTLFEKGKRDAKGANPVLKFYTKADPYMEVMLPHWFRKKFNKKKFPTDEAILNYLNNTEEGKSILTGVGFRIPTQSMSSIEVFRVKGFLPQSMGETIVVPSEVTAKAGSDFDIDKMNTYLKSIYIDKNGDIRLVKLMGTEESTKDFYGKVFDEKLENKKVKKDDLLELLQTRLYGLEDSKDLEGKYGELLDALLAETEETTDLETILVDELAKLGDKNLQAGLKERFVNDMYKRALENEYYDSLINMITLPENFDRLLSPVDDGGLKKLASELDTLRGQDETTFANRLLSRNYMTPLRNAFVSAKRWIGIAAVNITGQSLTQKAEIYIDPERIEGVNDFDKKILGDGKIALPHNTVTINGQPRISISGKLTADGKQYISDRLSGYATSFVDVAKDPYITKIIPSDSMVGIFMFLERIGVGENTVFFLNQPIIREYIKYLDSIGTKGLFSEKNINYIKGKFGTRAAKSFDINALKTNIQKYYTVSVSAVGITDELNQKENTEQVAIFNEFLKYAKMAEYNFKLTQATNYDTTKFRSGDSLFKKQTRTAIAKQKNIFSSVDKILEGSFIGKQVDFLDKSMEAIGSILKLEQDEFAVITDEVLRPFSEDEYLGAEDFERIATKLKLSFLDYVIQTKAGINSDIKELVVNAKTSVADQLAEAKKKFPNIKILNDLQVVSTDRVDGTKSIRLKANSKDAYDENMYTEMMRELRDNPETRDLYYDIVMLSILQGSAQTSISIKNIIPVEDYSEIIKPIIDTLAPTVDVQGFSKTGAFQRNNWKDEKIVPTVRPKFFKLSYIDPNTRERIEMDPMEDPDGNEIFTYTSPSFTSPILDFLKIEPTDRKILILSPKYNSQDVKSDFVKVPMVVTDKKTGEMVDMLSGQTVVPSTFAKRKAAGDLSLRNYFGYQKVKYVDGSPVLTAEGDYIYKLVNLYGDGQLVTEHYIDPQKSVLNNGTVQVENEIPDADIISYFAPIIEEEVTTVGQLRLKDGNLYNTANINTELLEKIGYTPQEIGKILKSIC